jgi:hypothetical protein
MQDQCGMARAKYVQDPEARTPIFSWKNNCAHFDRIKRAEAMRDSRSPLRLNCSPRANHRLSQQSLLEENRS